MFSTKGRILTVVALTASLVAMALGQQPPPRRESRVQRPARATTPPAVQSPSRPHTPPRAASATAELPDTPEASTPGAALAPSAAASEPSTILAPSAARTFAIQEAPVSPPTLNPQSTTPALAPSATVPPAARASWQVLPFQAQPASVDASTPSTMLAPVTPAQQHTPRQAQTRPQPATAQTPAATPRSPDYVEEKGFKGRVFEIKHRDPDSLAQVLRPLGSGFKGATISSNREFKILTVRDFPENIAAMEEAIKRLDTPEARSPDIEFTVHILIASSGEGPGSELPTDLGPVIKQLQSTLRYKTYNLMTSAIHRGKEGPVRVENSGIAESKLLGVTTPQGNPIFFNYSLQRISLDGAAASATVQIADFSFHMRAPLMVKPGEIQYENIGFNTPVSVREGEKVVVGTTSMGDKGLIVVVSAKVLK
ncbi:MAG TPA: secretin N-terminal domain-containing protein [Blastocatellia bacterium]|nr:secretin N-terminal domain-containing protein [Blastocatellia bacterium]